MKGRTLAKNRVPKPMTCPVSSATLSAASRVYPPVVITGRGAQSLWMK